ncbi:MAG: phosphatase PAP2 family protein [Anaerolinea sp.]|nr:phosphatase PAP2 family protein [Anaerolinea sp.]
MRLEKLLRWDVRLSEQLRVSPQQRWRWRWEAFLAHSGDSWFWALAMGLIWLSDWSSPWHRRAALLGIGIVVLAVLVLAIKFLVRRRRPEGEWGQIYRSTDPHSFPSGHAARAALLTVMAWGLGPLWFSIVVTLWLPLVSLARVRMGVHYLSDVLAGVVFGALAGLGMLAVQPVLLTSFPFLF